MDIVLQGSVQSGFLGPRPIIRTITGYKDFKHQYNQTEMPMTGHEQLHYNYNWSKSVTTEPVITNDNWPGPAKTGGDHGQADI